MFKVNNKDTRTILLASFCYFTPCSGVSIVKFEQVNAHWDNQNVPEWVYCKAFFKLLALEMYFSFRKTLVFHLFYLHLLMIYTNTTLFHYVYCECVLFVIKFCDLCIECFLKNN